MAGARGCEGRRAASRLLGALCLAACFPLVHGRDTGAAWTLEKVGHVCVSPALLASPLGCGGSTLPGGGEPKLGAGTCPRPALSSHIHAGVMLPRARMRTPAVGQRGSRGAGPVCGERR